MIPKFLLLIILTRTILTWCLYKTTGFEVGINKIDYSADRSMFITTSYSSQIVKVWNATNHMILAEFSKSPKNPSDVRFSKDNTIFAIGYEDSTVQVYSAIPPFGLIKSFNSNHGNGDIYLDFSQNSDMLMTCGGNNNKLRVWMISDLSSVLDNSDGTPSGCRFDILDNIVVTSSNNKWQYMDLSSLTNPSPLFSRTGIQGCGQVDISPNRDYSISVCNQGSNYRGRIVTTSTNSLTQVLSAGDPLRTATFAPDGQTFFFGGDDQTAYLYNASSGNNTLMLNYSLGGKILCSDFSRDGNYLLVGTDQGYIYQYAKYCLECEPGYYRNMTTASCQLCNEYMRGCSVCQNSSYCLSCKQGYHLDYTDHTCNSCNAIRGCGVCASSTVCEFCLPGYYLNSGTCTDCDTAMNGCMRCKSQTVCQQCTIDYYLDTSNTCVSCKTIGGCALCVSSSYCNSCQMGYYPTATGSCLACTTNCIVCTSATDCLDCAQGFYPSSGTCMQCSTGCLACNETGYCFDCQQNMYELNGVCTDCPYPCDQCNNQTQCLTCMVGYFLDSTTKQCLSCSPPCVTCNSSATDCVSCPLGYYLNSSSQCAPCDDLQSFCSECTPTVCLNCTLGYYLNSSNLCTPCSNDMFSCLTCTSISTCLQCSPGYYLTANTGNDSCGVCANGCALCDSGTYCHGCLPGYYLDTSNECQQCVPPCSLCVSSISCLQCQQSYYISGTNCVICSDTYPGCLSCDDEVTLLCTSCKAGMYLDLGSCHYCTNHCITCSDTECLSCDLGYFLDTGTCQLCPENCTQCTSVTSCQSCASGFYLDTVNNVCLHCSQIGCMTCNSTSDCLSCQAGYYLTATFSCEQCISVIDFCEICQDATTCISCSFGYTLALDSQSCVVCSSIPGCFDCSTTTVCQVCETGYYLDAGSCLICPQGCLSCTSALSCTTCAPGYTYSSATCNLCQDAIQGCQLCSSASVCIQCLNGYYLDAGNTCTFCRQVLKGCAFCNDSSICTYCDKGFYLTTGNTCEYCQIPMQGCQVCLSNSECVLCQNGYYLSAGDCLVCDAVLPGCINCNASNYCVQCIQGYSIVDISATQTQCQLCANNIQGCTACTSSSNCLQCEGGYYLGGDKLCHACQLDGCQVCFQSNSNKCYTCNTKYFLSSDRCYFCQSYIQGCIQCTSSSACTLCETGYFLNSTNKCQLCQESIEGCGKCSDSTTCLQCKTTYYLLDTGTCETCLLGIQGCAYCFNDTQCLACSSGYYLVQDTATCELCTNIDGCLVCSDSVNCLVCRGNYFLSSNSCYPCSVMQGCYSCSNNITCKVCIGGYILNDDLECQIMTVSADQGVQGMKFISTYQNDSCLSHSLLANQMSYVKQNYTIAQWNNVSDIILQYPDFRLQNLTITAVDYKGSNQLKYYSNNPLNIQLSSLPARRLLGAMPQGYKTYVEIKQETINVILPELYMSSNLVMDYDLNQPEFYTSFATSKTNYYFAIIGIIVTIILTVNYMVRALYSCKDLPISQHGQILPHILALKTPVFIIYPLFPEQIGFCYGFMTAEFPWAAGYFSQTIGDKSELLPQSYALFYSNMSIGSIYLIPLMLIIVVVWIMWFYHLSQKNGQNKEEQDILAPQKIKVEDVYLVPQWPIKTVAYNFFLFGLTFAACASLQGAILNPIQILTINSAFMALGIVLLVFAFADSILSICQSKLLFYRLRIFVKACLLSIAHFSPIYVYFAALGTDVLLMIIQFRLNRQQISHEKLWLTKNSLALLCLTLLVLVHSHFVTLMIATMIILSIIGMQFYVHYNDYKNQEKRSKFVFERNYEIADNQSQNQDHNIWNINFEKQTFNNNTSSSSEKHHKQQSKEENTLYKRKFHNKILKSKKIPEKKAESIETLNHSEHIEEQPNIFVLGDIQ